MSDAYELLKGAEPEVTIEKALATALAHDEFLDVVIRANDGVRVKANRTALALRSSVFRTMLLGGRFLESSSPVVEADYPGVVVEALVEYLHKDKAGILVELAPTSQAELDESAKREDFQTLVSLTAAAAYYSLPGLCQRANRCMSSYLKAFPALSFAVLEALTQHGPAISADMKEEALSNIRRADLESLDKLGLGLLSEDALELLSRDGKTVRTARRRFEIINLWFRADAVAGDATTDRQTISIKLVSDYVNLELIRPRILSTVVASSGLVTDVQLEDAYQRQAFRAERKQLVSFEKKSSFANPVWSGSGTRTATNGRLGFSNQALKCPPMLLGGVYRWELRIVMFAKADIDPFVWLGVASSTVVSSLSALGGPGCHGIYGYGGMRVIDGKSVAYLGDEAEFGDGDNVELTLNLSPEDKENGTLFVRVNGKRTIRASSNLRGNLGEGESYVPVLSCHYARVTLLRIKEL